MAHWLSVQSGDRIIYCSQVTTALTQDEITATRKPKRVAQESSRAIAPTVQSKATKHKTNFFAFSPQQTEIVSLHEPDEITVTKRTTTVTVKQDLAKEQVASKPLRSYIN